MSASALACALSLMAAGACHDERQAPAWPAVAALDGGQRGAAPDADAALADGHLEDDVGARPALDVGPSDGARVVVPTDGGVLAVQDPSAHVSISVEPGALVDDAGAAAVPPITVLLRPIAIAAYEDMPGGWRAVDGAGQTISHATGQVFELRLTSGNGRPLRLRAGRGLRVAASVDFSGPPVAMHLDEVASVWRPVGTAISDGASGVLEWKTDALGFWSVGRNAAPRCLSGVLRNNCDELVPNARLVAFGSNGGLHSAAAASSDAAGQFSFDGGFDDPDLAYDVRITAGDRTLRVRTRLAQLPPDCGREGALVFPSCDGVECYVEDGLDVGGGDCSADQTICPFNWGVYGATFCSDGHRYQWSCGGSPAAGCGCSCLRDDQTALRCTNAPAPCAEKNRLARLCLAGGSACGFPRHVPAHPQVARPCDSDADCIAVLPVCRNGTCAPG